MHGTVAHGIYAGSLKMKNYIKIKSDSDIFFCMQSKNY